ncbi:hypothetical protein LIER_39203 [Lithospermum erythrorhizon]|uniref:Aminotransferase-like plant mobile domain-containing protein n=1 Tax=Lithospermum erythrorhizon TaxID=34254 RepID=A0AAV3QBB6_LITER
MPFGKMTITLHDVFEILGLSCVGEPVLLNENDVVLEALLNHLCRCLDETGYKLYNLKFKFVKPSSMTGDQRAATYFLYLLGCVLFVYKTQTKGWTYEYFPAFRCAINLAWAEGSPRASRWEKLTTIGNSLGVLIKYHRILDNMTPDDFLA